MTKTDTTPDSGDARIDQNRLVSGYFERKGTEYRINVVGVDEKGVHLQEQAFVTIWGWCVPESKWDAYVGMKGVEGWVFISH